MVWPILAIWPGLLAWPGLDVGLDLWPGLLAWTSSLNWISILACLLARSSVLAWPPGQDFAVTWPLDLECPGLASALAFWPGLVAWYDLAWPSVLNF